MTGRLDESDFELASSILILREKLITWEAVPRMLSH